MDNEFELSDLDASGARFVRTIPYGVYTITRMHWVELGQPVRIYIDVSV